MKDLESEHKQVPVDALEKGRGWLEWKEWKAFISD